MVLLTIVYIIATVSSIYGFVHGLHTLVTGQLADTPTRGLPTPGLDVSRTGQLADWTTRGCRR